MADLSSPANVERMLNAIDLALRTHESEKSIPGPVLAWGIWTTLPDNVPSMTLDPTAKYRTTATGIEVVLTLDDPGGDGIAPIVRTNDVPEANLLRVVIDQSITWHGAGIALPNHAPGTDSWDAALSGMTNRRHLVSTPYGGHEVRWDGDARTEPTPLAISHVADLLAIQVGSEPAPISEATSVAEGLLTLRFFEAVRTLDRNIKTKQVVDVLATGAEGAVAIGQALARQAADETWSSLYGRFAAAEPSIAEKFNLATFSRLLPAAEARLYEVCKVSTATFLREVVLATREVSA